MKRRLFSLLSALSLLMCIGAAAVSLLGLVRKDGIGFYRDYRESNGIATQHFYLVTTQSGWAGLYQHERPPKYRCATPSFDTLPKPAPEFKTHFSYAHGA